MSKLKTAASTATNAASSKIITIAGMDLNPVKVGMDLWIGSRTQRTGNQSEITAVTPAGGPGTLGGTLEVADNMPVHTAVPCFVDTLGYMGGAAALATWISVTTLGALQTLLGAGLSLVTGTKILVLDAATEAQSSLIRLSAAGGLRFLIERRMVGSTDRFAIRASPDGTELVDALTIDRATATVDYLSGSTDRTSGATCDIGANPTRKVTITGTTTITSFGSGANKERLVRFAGALTLTHNATSLILPTGANYQTAAGDRMLAVSDASGNWTVIEIWPAKVETGFRSSPPLVVGAYGPVQPADDRTQLHVVNKTAGTSGRVLLDGYGYHTFLSFRRASGTVQAPSAVLANDSFGGLSAWGYGATGYNAGPGSGMVALDLRAGETWTDTAQGAYFAFETAANGGNTRVERARITPDGLLAVGYLAPLASNTPRFGVSATGGFAASYPAGTVTQVSGAAATPARHVIDAFASSGQVAFRKANGTSLLPTALGANELIGSIAMFGYGATGYTTGSRALVAMYSAEAWTDTAQGSYIALHTTATGGVAQTERVRVDPSGGLRPAADNTYPLGTASFRWSNVYSAAVTVDPTFTLGMVGASPVLTFDTGDYNYYDRTTNAFVWSIGATNHYAMSATALYPLVTNVQTLGSPSALWSTVYAGTGAINTSNAELKTEVSAIADRELDAWGEVRIGAYQFLDAVEAKGASKARWHYGRTHQDVAEAYRRHGVAPERLALWCVDDEVIRATKTRRARRPKVETFVVDEVVIEMDRGKAVQRSRKREETRTVTRRVAVLDEKGRPVMRKVDGATEDAREDGETEEPVFHDQVVMEEFDETFDVEEKTGQKVLGLRTDYCHVIEAAYQRRRAERIESRLTAIEAQLAAEVG